MKKIDEITTLEEIFTQWEEIMPPVIDRSTLTDITNGVINSRYISNLMSRSEGPSGVRIGKKVLILRKDLFHWLRSRYVSAINNENNN